jgi:internalin A
MESCGAGLVGRKEILAAIEIKKVKGSSKTSLDLQRRWIDELPREIGESPNLTSLDLSYNRLRALPGEIGQLTNLTSLDLRYNQLTALPEAIGQLTNLTSLSLSYNQLTTLPEAIGQLTNLISLSLSYNQLTVLPEAIGQLTNLTSLDLSSIQLTVLPESIGQLTNLNSLDLSSIQLTALPESIGQLTNLTSLDLRYNQLAALPESIGQLTNLISLDLRYNQLTELPESIGQLTNLTSLELRYNQLTELPESIGQLTKLTSLDLSSIQLTELPESIGQLTNLTSLDLSSIQLTELPESIGQLTNLTSLDLRYNQLTELPESIGQLTNLTSLDLYSNQLTALPESIGQLTNLTSLDLRSNQLTELPESISRLNYLLILTLRLADNPLLIGIPTEVVRKGGWAIVDYCRQRLEEQTDYIYEAKLLIIGEPGAGKTSLANKVVDVNYQLKLEGTENHEKSTEGIDVLRLDFPHLSGNPFRINIWDFGGQEIYHATHQFFLTKRSLYLLIADTRQENTDFNYWLEIVELLTEARPTLIIKNEKQDRPCQVNENQLRGRFPNLEKILPTNLATNRGLSEILTAVQHHISQLPHIGQALPKTWVNVRKALETDSRNHITQTEFLTLCDSHGFKRHADKLQLSGYLHDLGVCLHFQDDDLLQRTIILKPEWGTTAVYKVLDTPKVCAAFGHFTSDDIKTIWADEQYTAMRPELLQLMKNFKLCYEIPHSPKTYIAPQLLSANQPEYQWDDTDNLILRYEYDFMPKGMLTRFIVEMHRLIDQDLVWKEGVILTQGNARAEVIETYYKKNIRIRISGPLKKPLLEAIRHEFSKIHDSYNKPEDPPENHRLRYQEFIPCNCSVCKGSQTPHFYSLKRLEERLKNQRNTIECDISYQQVIVRNLLDDTIGQTNFPQDFRRDRYTEDCSPNTTIINNYLNQEQQMSNDTRPNIAGDYVAGSKNVHSGSGDNVSGTKIVNSQNLTQAAQDIKALLDQLAIDYPNEDEFIQGGRALSAIKKDPTLKTRLINAAKEAGIAAFEKTVEAITDNPAAGSIVAGIKGFIEADG